jgi:3-hydroxyacyl-[acyl-carrier-protein] dehydratase
MLIRDFYHIESQDHDQGEITALIRLNADHAIYNGHFPGLPVVPGVVQLQIIKELVEGALQEKLLLTNMSSAKYLQMIIPSKNSRLACSISYKHVEGLFKITAAMKEKDLVFTKIKASFMPVK